MGTPMNPLGATCGVPHLSAYSGPASLTQVQTAANSTLNVTFTVPEQSKGPYNVSLLFRDETGNLYCIDPINMTGIASDNIHMVQNPYFNFTVSPFPYPVDHANKTLGVAGNSFAFELSGNGINGAEAFWTASANYSIVNSTHNGGDSMRVEATGNGFILAIVAILLVIQSLSLF